MLTFLFVIRDERVSSLNSLFQESCQVFEYLVIITLHRLVKWRPGWTKTVDRTENRSKLIRF